jgi:hypothetical protein
VPAVNHAILIATAVEQRGAVASWFDSVEFKSSPCDRPLENTSLPLLARYADQIQISSTHIARSTYPTE